MVLRFTNRNGQKGVFLVTEYLAKGTLTSVLATDEPSGTSWMWKAHVRSWFPLKEALRQAAGVASALAYMHGEAMPVSFWSLSFESDTYRAKVLSCEFFHFVLD